MGGQRIAVFGLRTHDIMFFFSKTFYFLNKSFGHGEVNTTYITYNERMMRSSVRLIGEPSSRDRFGRRGSSGVTKHDVIHVFGPS